MVDLLIPTLVGLFFIVLFLSKRQKISTDTKFWSSPSTAYEELSFGKIWHYDNINAENKDKEPWVFIHSIGSSIYSWRYQIEAFSTEQRVVALDLLGFGQSDKPLNADYSLDASAQRILDFLDQKKIQHCKLIGCSLGGALCLWLKILAPERFSQILVISPAATPKVVPLLRIPHEKLALLGKRIVSRSIIKIALRGGLAFREKITPDVIEHYFAPFAEPEAVTCFLKSISTLKDPRIFNSLNQLQPEVLVLWGEKDRVVPRSAMQQILKQIPRAQLKTHPEGGHHLMEDAPEWTNLTIQNFFCPSTKAQLDS
ncbi:alpha/beta hydrolase [bacterium]|nr:alpha/beta hydrolase [bacterium]